MAKESTVKKGRKLEDEVADIYRNIDGVVHVIQNHSIMGIQIDIYVEMEGSDGIKVKYAIDAKNYNSNVSSDHARKCITDFNVLRQQNKIDKGVIVAAIGFTKDANAAVIDAGHTALVISDLRKRALDFSSYLNAWIKSYEQDELPRMLKYISLTAKKTEGTSIGNLDKYLLKWLKGEGNHITLLGNYGTGKSTTLKHIMNIQAQKYLDDPDNERIPIFIELKGFRQAPKSRQLITDILVNEFSLNINYRKFQELNEKGKFLIILDGFDEMADRVFDGLPNEHFDELSAFACDKGKVILSSRTHYFKDHEQLLEVHAQGSDLLSQVETRNGFEILFLNSFSEKDINEYLKTVYESNWEHYKSVIKKTYDLYSLAEVPILLNMIVQTLPDMINKGIQINRPAIYEIFTEKWLNRDNWRRALHKSERLYFCIQLALYFYTNQQNSVHWSDLPRFIREYFKERVKSHSDLDIFDADIRTSNFLKRKEDSGQYSFIHKSFMEYFVARYFHENIRKKVVNGLDQLKDYTRSKVIYEFLLEMLDKKDLEIMHKDIRKTESYDYSKMMIRKEKGSSRIYTNPESLGNCAYLLSCKGYSLENTILDAAELSGFEISNASFKDARLTGAKFKNCKLTNVSFGNAAMPYSNFQNSTLSNIDFTGTLLEKADFRDTSVDSFTISTIARAEHWGAGKYSAELRKKLDKAYIRPGDSISYQIDEEDV